MTFVPATRLITGPASSWHEIQTLSSDWVRAHDPGDGMLRRLDYLPQGNGQTQITTVKALQGAGVLPSIPQAQWIETKPQADLLYLPQLDQGQYGSCTGHGTDTGFMICRSLNGFPNVLLSPTFIYAQVNGNRDAGAYGPDAVQVLVDTGTCLMSEFGEDTIYKRQIPGTAYDTAKRFRATTIAMVEDFDDFMTCLQVDAVVCFPVQVGMRFNNLDGDGCAPCGRGPGNHWVVAYATHKTSSGEWVPWCRNSWSASWGINGGMGIHQAGICDGAVAIMGAAPDPQQDLPPGG